MTGPELKAIRLKLGLTPTQFGIALGYTGKCGINIHHMEAGRKTITPTVARLAKMFAKYGLQNWILEALESAQKDTP